MKSYLPKFESFPPPLVYYSENDGDSLKELSCKAWHANNEITLSNSVRMPGTNSNNPSSSRPQFSMHLLLVLSSNIGLAYIIIICTDADLCMIIDGFVFSRVALKQNKYPIFFLTQGDTDLYEKFKDIRAQSLESALYFAKSINILGLSVFSSIVKDDVSIIHKILNKKLILFLWGDELSSKEAMDYWRNIGVHGIIYDRIHEFNQQGSMNIFHLPNRTESDINSFQD